MFLNIVYIYIHVYKYLFRLILGSKCRSNEKRNFLTKMPGIRDGLRLCNIMYVTGEEVSSCAKYDRDSFVHLDLISLCEGDCAKRVLCESITTASVNEMFSTEGRNLQLTFLVLLSVFLNL